MGPEVRRRLEQVYADSNQVTRAALGAHGYRDLPGWLHGAGAAG
jgi:hypothetical protein